jgi:hypothetical protein
MAKRGRPLNDDDFFAMEVDRVMRAHDCGVRAACQRIAKGGKRSRAHVVITVVKKGEPPRRVKGWTVGSRWRGMNAETLEWRYFAWKRREEARQKSANFEN